MKLISQALTSTIICLGLLVPGQAIPAQLSLSNSLRSTPARLARVPLSEQLFMRVRRSSRGIHRHYLLLSQNGTAVRTRAGHLATRRQNLKRSNHGRYSRQGNQLIIQWGDGERWQMKEHPNGWQLGSSASNIFATAHPIPLGRLRGRFAARSSRPARLVNGQISAVSRNAQTMFLFSGDGSFQRTSFETVRGRTKNTTRQTATNRNRTGRYQIDQYQLILSDTQDNRTQHTIFRLAGWGDTLFIDGQKFQPL